MPSIVLFKCSPFCGMFLVQVDQNAKRPNTSVPGDKIGFEGRMQHQRPSVVLLCLGGRFSSVPLFVPHSFFPGGFEALPGPSTDCDSALYDILNTSYVSGMTRGDRPTRTRAHDCHGQDYVCKTVSGLSSKSGNRDADEQISGRISPKPNRV